MIAVTGTKRSGTSMWMQVLRAAGLPVIGEAFPGRWRDTIAEANRDGFYESRFRRGINFLTNPDAKTGVYLSPQSTRNHVVKIFVPGLVRSDVAFLDKVLVTVRPVREYCTSIERLYEIERTNQGRLDGVEPPPREHLHPALEWWDEVHGIVADVLVRGLPAHFVAYDATLDSPDATVREVIGWLGVGDESAAVAAVLPERRTQRTTEAPELPGAFGVDELALCDELYARIRERRGIDAEFIDRLNDANERLAPVVASERTRIRRARVAARAASETPG